MALGLAPLARRYWAISNFWYLTAQCSGVLLFVCSSCSPLLGLQWTFSSVSHLALTFAPYFMRHSTISFCPFFEEMCNGVKPDSFFLFISSAIHSFKPFGFPEVNAFSKCSWIGELGTTVILDSFRTWLGKILMTNDFYDIIFLRFRAQKNSVIAIKR